MPDDGRGAGKLAQILHTTKSLAAPYVESDDEIRERHLKHIREISKVLSPPKSEELTYEQHQWLKFRMARPFPEPYKVWAKRTRQRLQEGRGLED